MRSFIRLLFLAGIVAGAVFASDDVPKYVPGSLIAAIRQDAQAPVVSRLLASHGARTRRNLGRTRIAVLQVPESTEESVRHSLAASGLFEYVERDAIARGADIPNDPSFVSQWHLPKIKAPEAWRIQKGDPGLVMAVIDSGVDVNHPDLRDRLAPGWNFLTGSGVIVDNTGHGTAVTGVIAAATNNATGVAGMNWESKVMPLVVLDSNNSASYSNIAGAIYWAADRGVRIINISIGGPTSSITLQRAVDYALQRQALIFAAAMNTGNSTRYYPAACNGVLAVAATDMSDNRAPFSVFGNWIGLSAPGTSILTTARGGGYSFWSGTSFASPLAAGVASLVLSARPGITAAELAAVLQQTADDLGTPEKDAYFGYGRVNAERALAQTVPPLPAITVAVTPASATLGPSQTQQFSAAVAGTSNAAIQWSISPAIGSISADGLYTAPASVPSTVTVTVTATSIAGPGKPASAAVTLAPPPAVSTARFMGLDSTTRGNWKGVYGGEGYSIAANASQIPSYAALSLSHQLAYTWAASTADNRALQQPAGQAYVASTWYSSTSFEITAAFAGTARRQIAIYCLDWDWNGRAQRIEVLDFNGSILDTRDVASFRNGVYVVWEVSGPVRLRVTRSAGMNAVVSGFFFQMAGTSPSAVRFLGADSITRGNWKGVYGGRGYSIAMHHTQLPSQVALTFSDKSEYLWADGTSDSRGLQRVATPGHVASTWFSASAFEIGLTFPDNLPRRIALYFLDWDRRGRGQQVEILDPAGSTILDSRPVSLFDSGVFHAWEVAGTVRIRITRTASINAVLSGIFVD